MNVSRMCPGCGDMIDLVQLCCWCPQGKGKAPAVIKGKGAAAGKGKAAVQEDTAGPSGR